MFGLKINTAKSFFFDAPRVLASVDQATARNLSLAGSYVRKAARGLIRKVGKKGKPSNPGQPPKSRTGVLKDFLFFAYEPSRRTVVVGPAKTNQVFFKRSGKPISGTAPEVLEYGGEISVLEWWLPSQQKWSRVDLRSKRKIEGRKTRLRTVRIAARPYMAPAEAKARPDYTAVWANSLKSRAA